MTLQDFISQGELLDYSLYEDYDTNRNNDHIIHYVLVLKFNSGKEIKIYSNSELNIDVT